MTSRRTCEQLPLREDSGPLASRFLLPTYAAISGDTVRVTDPFDFPVKFFHEIEHALQVPRLRAAPRPSRATSTSRTRPGCTASRPPTTSRSRVVPGLACTTSASPPTRPTKFCAAPTSSARCARNTTSCVPPDGTASASGWEPHPSSGLPAQARRWLEGGAGRGTARLQGHGVRRTIGALPTVPFPAGLQDERARECSTHSSGSLMGIGGRYRGGGRRDVRCSRSRGRLTARRFHRPTDCGGTPGSKSRR